MYWRDLFPVGLGAAVVVLGWWLGYHGVSAQFGRSIYLNTLTELSAILGAAWLIARIFFGRGGRFMILFSGTMFISCVIAILVMRR